MRKNKSLKKLEKKYGCKPGFVFDPDTKVCVRTHEDCAPGWTYDSVTDTCKRVDNRTITIKVFRGVVDSVENLPPGWSYKIIDLYSYW